MTEVSGPIVAIALVLCAVFVPMAFLTVSPAPSTSSRSDDRDLDRDLGVNSLTLSPAARPPQIAAFARRAKGYASRLIDRLLGWFFRHSTLSSRQARTTTRPRFAHARPTRCGIHGLCRAAGGHRADVQRGAACFIPTQDKLYLIAGVKLPEGSR